MSRPVASRPHPPSDRAIRHMLRATEGIAAVEFALIVPFLLVLLLGGLEIAKYANTTRQLNNLANSIGTLVSERTTPLNFFDAAFTLNSTMVTFPTVLSESAAQHTVWYTDLAMTLSSISFTPTVAGCTSGCTYKAKVDWSINTPTAGTRSCVVPPTAVANTSRPTLSTLPTDVFTAGSIVVADIRYVYRPAFGSSIVPTITIARSSYLQPRYLPKIAYTVVPGDPGYTSCP